jgi:hypothetical protein
MRVERGRKDQETTTQVVVWKVLNGGLPILAFLPISRLVGWPGINTPRLTPFRAVNSLTSFPFGAPPPDWGRLKIWPLGQDSGLRYKPPAHADMSRLRTRLPTKTELVHTDMSRAESFLTSSLSHACTCWWIDVCQPPFRSYSYLLIVVDVYLIFSSSSYTPVFTATRLAPGLSPTTRGLMAPFLRSTAHVA